MFPGARTATALFLALAVTSSVASPVTSAAGATETPLRAERQMIAAANPLAAETGRDILRAGGSAVDAAIAMEMVLNLVEPQSSGIGGGAFLLHYDAASRSVAAYDGRETAPASATPEHFLTGDGTPMKFWDAVVGGRSVGVPGLLRMLELAHRDHGRLPWAQLFAPAIALAETGFPVSPRLRDLIARDKHLKTSPGAAAYFHDAGGAPLAVGTVLKNPAFARTLRAVAEDGAEAFYRGPIADAIVAAVREAPQNPTQMSPADLAGYRAVRREALCAPYRKWRVCGMPPPTSGGIAVLQTLGILESFDLGARGPGDAASLHLIAEASRLAFADRNRFLADSDFVEVPVDRLLDADYLKRRAALISPETSLGKAEPGLPSQSGTMPVQSDPPSTTHLAVVDSSGNAVSMTASIESAFGSRLMVAGFLLNNELTDFSFRPLREGRTVANRVEAGKRPRSSMAPTLVLDRDGNLVLAIGSPGGSRIIGYVVKSLVATLDWGLDVQAAISLPNFVNRNGATDLEAETAVVELAPRLEALGHDVKIRAMTSGLHGIWVGPDGLLGGADPRREGVALGD